MSIWARSVVSWVLLASLCVGCGGDDDGGGSESAVPRELTQEASGGYQDVAFAAYEESFEGAVELYDAVRAFVDEPTESSLEIARQAWFAAREPYLQTEVFRFYEGPIDAEDSGPERWLNAWPIDESYVDYVEDDEESGLVNDPDFEINADNLVELNQADDETTVTTGYHAIEFLLWGQDLDDDGPGARPYTDFLTDGEGSNENQERRGEYLLATADLLLDHLELLVFEWAPGESGNYRAGFEELEPEEALRRILTGMLVTTRFEIREREVLAALESADPREEQSAFSDNGHRDLVQQLQGISNAYLGSYVRLDGGASEGTASVKDVVATHDPALALQLERTLLLNLAKARSLPKPFDQLSNEDNDIGRERLEVLSDSLETQAGLLEQVFRAFGLQLPEDPS